MVDHELIALACRARLVSLAVCTTGAVSLSATATGYARVGGSFLTDGFAEGQELNATGFGTAQNNGTAVVTDVSALALTVTKDGGTIAEVAAGGRTLAVGLPATRGWDNRQLNTADGGPVAGVPYIEEDYLPGPAAKTSIGPLGQLEVTPQYVIRVYAAANIGRSAFDRVAKAILTLFAPGTAIALSNGDVVRVRGDVAPYAGQILQDTPGFAVQTITIPLLLRTVNAI